MTQDTLINIALPWVHYMAVLFMVGAAITQLQLLKLAGYSDSVRMLTRVDRIYGVTALLVLVTGVLRMYYGGKGASWYWSNGLMHGVIGAFVLAALISIVPTIRFMRWQKAFAQNGTVPQASEVKSTKILVHVQLALVAVVTLLITMVAKGYGAKNALPESVAGG